MRPATPYIVLKGSERALPKGAIYAGPVDAQEQIEVSVYVSPRNRVATTLRAQQDGKMPRLSRQQYTELHGAHPDDVAQVESFALNHGLRVVTIDHTRRLVMLAGTVAAMSQA